MDFFFLNWTSVVCEKCGVTPSPQPQTQFSFWISKVLTLLFLNSCKLCKNSSELVDTLSLKKSEIFFGPTRDMQNVCTVAKGGPAVSGTWENFVTETETRITLVTKNLFAFFYSVKQSIPWKTWQHFSYFLSTETSTTYITCTPRFKTLHLENRCLQNPPSLIKSHANTTYIG